MFLKLNQNNPLCLKSGYGSSSHIVLMNHAVSIVQTPVTALCKCRWLDPPSRMAGEVHEPEVKE